MGLVKKGLHHQQMLASDKRSWMSGLMAVMGQGRLLLSFFITIKTKRWDFSFLCYITLFFISAFVPDMTVMWPKMNERKSNAIWWKIYNSSVDTIMENYQREFTVEKMGFCCCKGKAGYYLWLFLSEWCKGTLVSLIRNPPKHDSNVTDTNAVCVYILLNAQVLWSQNTSD